MITFNTLTQNRRKALVLVAIISLVVLSTVAAVIALRKPSSEDFVYAKTAVTNVTKTQQALPTVANEYFAAFSREFNASGSMDKAKQNTSKEYDAFMRAKSSAMGAIKVLQDTKAANDSDVERAIEQYATVNTKRAEYYAGMVASYGDYKGLFASSSDGGCSGIFIGSTQNLSDRKTRLQKAAADCYPTIDTLKKSKNSTYVEYAFQMDRRVRLLEQDVAAIVKSEQQNNEFSKQLPVFEQKAADAKARNAQEKEVLALADEIKAVTVKIQDNKADFDFASKRYLTTTKEFPTLTEAVFSTTIPAKLKNFTSLSEVRLATLNLVLDDMLVD